MGDYRVILADPPWEGINSAHWYLRAKGETAPRKYYPTMALDEVAQLPIPDLAASNSALFIWTTGYLLAETTTLIQGWGFRYSGVGFTWVKLDRMGRPLLNLGQYTRTNTEYCMLGIKGRMTRRERNISQVIMSRRRQHSRKPDEQYDRIMRLFDGPYLELFARQQWPGWDVWGNEAGKFPAQTFLIPEQMLEVAS